MAPFLGQEAGTKGASRVTVVWSPRAIGHLAELRGYVARDIPDAAARTAATLIAAVDRLAEFPNLGRPGRVSGTQIGRASCRERV